jgi:hypothetical protein
MSEVSTYLESAGIHDPLKKVHFYLFQIHYQGNMIYTWENPNLADVFDELTLKLCIFLDLHYNPENGISSFIDRVVCNIPITEVGLCEAIMYVA